MFRQLTSIYYVNFAAVTAWEGRTAANCTIQLFTNSAQIYCLSFALRAYATRYQMTKTNSQV